MIPTINPWKGLQPYDDSKEDLKSHPFCGRERVIRELFDLIDNNIITTLYGRSGIGKTSLLKAGLFPKLRKEDYVPVYVRLGIDRKVSENFAECIIRILQNKMSFLDRRDNELFSMPEDNNRVDYLWAHFAKYSYYDGENRVKFPVVVLDQFEEVFNDDSNAIRLLLLQLHELTSDKLLPSGEKFLINFRIALSIREDDLFLLEDAIDTYYTPLLKTSRYRLKPLSQKEAIRVIEVRQSNNIALCEDLFDLDQKDDIINSIIQVAATSEKNNEINTQILSLTCKLLFDKWINKEGYCSINYNVIQECDIIEEFYYNTISQLPIKLQTEFEDNLVTESGRRKAWDYDRGYKSFYLRAFPEYKEGDKDHFLEGENAILRNITTHGTKCVELVHDSLAKVAIRHLSIYKENEKHCNERKKRENVLTIFGRELFTNQFVDFGPDDSDDTRTSLASDLIRSNFSPQNFISKLGVTSLSQIIEDSNAEDNSLYISFGKTFMTKDGIYKLWVKFDEQQRISKIRFYGQSIDDKDLIITRNGFCGMELEYDEFGNEITRKYLGKNDEPTINIFCYSMVRRTYDKFGRPILTMYYDIDGKEPCRHYDGNYGFMSHYDDKGNEILRTFIDDKKDLCQIRSGVYGQKAIYNDEDEIKYVINIDKQLNPCKNFWGVTAIHLEYDQLQRIHKETICDVCGEKMTPANCRNGYSISVYNYDSDSRIASCSFYNSQEQKVLVRDGFHKININYDENGFPSLATFLGLKNETMVISNGLSSVRRVYNEIGQEIEHQYLGPDLEPMYNIALFCYQRTEYEGCLKSSETFLNHKYHIIPTGVNRIEYEWDRYGYHITKEKYFDSLHREPIRIVKKEWNSDYDFIANDVYNNGLTFSKRIHLDPAGREIYEECLNQDTGWHHKRMIYNDSSQIFREMYFNEDESPYVNEIGDSGTEFIYDNWGVIIGHASLDEEGARRINKHGYCVEIIELDKKSDSKIYKYFDVDGTTPLKNGEQGCHINECGKAFYDESGNLCNNVFGYAEKRVDDNSQSFFDSSGNPVMAFGFHKLVTTKSHSITTECYYNTTGDLVVNDEGYAVRVLDENPGFFCSASKTIKYLGSDGKEVDVSCPECNGIKGSTFYFRKNAGIESIIYALNSKGETIEGSRQRDIFYKIKAALLIIPILIYGIISYVFFGIKVLIFKLLHKNKNKNKDKRTVINVKSIFDVTTNRFNLFDDEKVPSLSRIALIRPNDIILQFGDWDYLEYEDQNECVDAFEKEFYAKFKKCKKITIARIIKDSNNNIMPEIESFWVPDILLGFRLGDGDFNGTDKELSLLLDSYKKQRANGAP